MTLKMQIDVPAVFATRHDNCEYALRSLEDAARTNPELVASMMELRRRLWAIGQSAESLDDDLVALAVAHPDAFRVRGTTRRTSRRTFGWAVGRATRLLEFADTSARWAADPYTALGPVPPARKSHRDEVAVWANPSARSKVAAQLTEMAARREQIEASYWELAIAITQELSRTPAAVDRVTVPHVAGV